MPISLFAHTLALDGDDALAFAQAQFSSNVNGLPNGRWQFSAWLDPRGRVRFFFHLVRLADRHLLLLLRGGDASDMGAALQRYVFRSRVRISVPPAGVLGTGPALPLHAVRGAPPATDNALPAHTLVLGCDTHSLVVGSAAEADDAWRLLQMRAHWAWLPDNALEHWLPPALGLDRLGATALDKGCYPGQELVARLHYRGGHKRHLQQVRLSRSVPPGSALWHDGRELMRLLDVVPTDAGAEALAVVPDEVLADDISYDARSDTEIFDVQVTICKTPFSPAVDDNSAQ